MDSALKEITTIRVPDEDPAIAQSFVELDDRIDEWGHAVSQAHEQLVRREAECESAARTRESDASDDSASGVDAPAARAAAAGEVEPRDDSGGGVVMLSGRKPRTVVQGASPADEIDESPAESQPPATEPPGAAADAAKLADKLAECEADEELLATLDEETARAIRIRKRLCRGKKSVQELLNELKPATRIDAKKPKSLRRPFRRGQ